MSSKEFQKLTSMITEGFKKLHANTKEILSLEEAAIYLGVTEKQLYNLNNKNVIPRYKPNGKLIYYKKAELDTWLLKNKISSAEEITVKSASYEPRKKRVRAEI